ncbi:hypothetical protein D3870_04865 [Noviherbaspirillum cavernae]|uniref:SMP-30/Gluconolactonase/LRE-like region domain-containing protein n=1 Tax=Noviherbaspirillum cavernae TaxID=2320862 RepID=A0A418WZ21_9BURK|nr:hypothetical protein D3870_04865 [Noviherbaspirillum cavernae]
MAGIITGFGDVDGNGAEARFGTPDQMVVDKSGNVIVAERWASRLKRITPAGEVSTLATQMQVCGPSDTDPNIARYCAIDSLALDNEGNVFFADDFTLKKWSASGKLTVVAGGGTDTSANTSALALKLGRVAGLLVDPSGNIYVSEGDNFVVRRISPNGQVTTIAGKYQTRGFADGQGADVLFFGPGPMTFDPSGNIYILDVGKIPAVGGGPASALVRKMTPSGTVTTLAGKYLQHGYLDGAGSAARFDMPTAIAADTVGNLYIADPENNAIRRMTPEGIVSTVIRDTSQFDTPHGMNYHLDRGSYDSFEPFGLVLDKAGNLVFSDPNRSFIGKVENNGTYSVLAGAPWDAAQFPLDGGPVDLIASADGLQWDPSDSTLLLLVNSGSDPSGYSSTKAISRKVALDGGFSTLPRDPNGIRTDYTGTTQRQFSQTGGFVGWGWNYVQLGIPNAQGLYSTTMIAGKIDGSIQENFRYQTDIDGPGKDAQFSHIYAAAADKDGNVYVSQTNRSVIRKIDTNGVVSIFAGVAGVKGNIDGQGVQALFNEPRNLVTGPDGSLFVYDSANNNIRKITPSGVVTTVLTSAASYGVAYNGGYVEPVASMVVDSEGNLYVADEYSTIIRKVTPSGKIVAVADTGTRRGIHLGSNAPSFNPPRAMTLIGPNTLAILCQYAILTVKSPLIGRPQ